MPDLIDNVKFLPMVLVVDDSDTTALILSGLLGQEYRLKFAKNGEDALAIAAGAEKPDLILLDVVLPDFDGFEVSRQLREQDATRDIPIIFLSAMNDPADQIKGFEAGCVDYITKPFDPQTILLRVRAHVSRHGHVRKLRRKIL